MEGAEYCGCAIPGRRGLKEHGAFPGVISVLPCWGRRSPLYGGSTSPVRGFGFDCTDGGSSPHGVAVLPSRRVRHPRTEVLTSPHDTTR